MTGCCADRLCCCSRCSCCSAAADASGACRGQTRCVREWTVAGGLIENDEGLLLVQNRRRNGSLDWRPPGGGIEVGEGETLLEGLTREVEEETGVRVTEWVGPLYAVDAEAPGLGWRLHAEVHLAVAF